MVRTRHYFFEKMSEQQKNNLPPNTDNFDESGSAFAFFCLSLLTLYLVPATISRVWSLFAGKRERESKKRKRHSECARVAG